MNCCNEVEHDDGGRPMKALESKVLVPRGVCNSLWRTAVRCAVLSTMPPPLGALLHPH
jgi:hypothetical protein